MSSTADYGKADWVAWLMENPEDAASCPKKAWVKLAQKLNTDETQLDVENKPTNDAAPKELKERVKKTPAADLTDGISDDAIVAATDEAIDSATKAKEYVLDFGKYNGELLESVIKKDKSYVQYLSSMPVCCERKPCPCPIPCFGTSSVAVRRRLQACYQRRPPLCEALKAFGFLKLMEDGKPLTDAEKMKAAARHIQAALNAKICDVEKLLSQALFVLNQ